MDIQSTRVLQFEKPITEIEGRIEELKRGGSGGHEGEVERLESRLADLEVLYQYC